MKTITKLTLMGAVGLVLASAAVYAQSASEDPPPVQPPGRLPPGRPGVGPLLKGLLQKYDANKDGQLDKTEMAALVKDIDDGKIGPPPPRAGRGGPGSPGGRGGPRGPGGPGWLDRPGGPGGPSGPGGPGFGHPPKEILDKYDQNKDGKLDEEERAAMRKDIEEGKLEPPPFMARPGGPQGAGGVGGEGGAAFGPPPKAVLEKYDLDKDGKLDERELAAFLKDAREHRLAPPRGGGEPPKPDSSANP